MNNSQYRIIEAKLIPIVEMKLNVKYLYFDNAIELYFFKRKTNRKNKLDPEMDMLTFSFKEMRKIFD